MNPIMIKFNQRLNTLVQDASQRQKVLAAAVATVAAKRVGLPSAETTDIHGYFMDNGMSKSYDLIDYVNEGSVFNTKWAVELTKRFWQVRYNAAFPKPFLITQKANSCFFSSLIGVASVVSPEEIEFLNKWNDEIFSLANELEFLLKEREND
jgi:hypothetical protein